MRVRAGRAKCGLRRRWALAAAAVIIALGAAQAAHAQLRIVTYNTAQGPRSGMDTILESIGEESTGGIARPIDVLVLQEQASPASTTQSIVNLLNGIYGAGTYARGSLSGDPFWSDIRQSVVYNTQSVQLIGEIGVGNAGNAPLQPRETIRHQFRPVGYGSSADFFIYNSHYKAGADPDDLSQRLVEANAIRANADALGEGTHAIYAGDFNMQSASESAYAKLLSGGNGQAFDPVNVGGTWHNNSSVARWHTQSPSDGSTGLVGGGIDDRFDFQLVTGEWQDDEGLAYIGGSYHTFGNNGSTYNDPVNSGNTITFNGVTSHSKTSILDALAAVSDHLPVVADYQLPALMAANIGTLPGEIGLGASVSIDLLIENIANVVAVNGADELDYSFSVSGDLFGSGSGTDFALGGPSLHQVALDTSALGARSGFINVLSTSQGVGNGTISIPVNFFVGPGGGGTRVTLGRDDFNNDQGLISFTQSPVAGAFGSPGDGFEKYQVGVSTSIPFNLVDDSFSVFPNDTLGVVDASPDSPGFKGDAWFGVTDTVNTDNPSGAVSATWVFDIEDATDIEVSIDMAAMGDFEAGGDVYDWTYSIDGAAAAPLFTSSIDESISAVPYQMADGDIIALDDPLIMTTTSGQEFQLGNFFQTLLSAIVGTGSELTIQFAGKTDGDEAYVFDNILITGIVGALTEGDFDGDGDVDGDDFLAWQGGFGIASGATLSDGDADGDGDVDGDDFLIWQSNFGTGSGAGAVPEPGSAVLALLACFVAFCMRRWHNKKVA